MTLLVGQIPQQCTTRRRRRKQHLLQRGLVPAGPGE
ncbi:hypothetical protein P3T35_007997 [Kitasatospora sp. GP30]|nr:hypothetical protein [Kitasatospora sp. GP30]